MPLVPPLSPVEAEIVNGLDSVIRTIALRHRAEAISLGLPFTFLSGIRSRSQQAALSSDPNRTTPAAKPGYSKHEVGGAYDLVRQTGPVELKVGVMGERLGLRWGGRFSPTPDPNHFEAPVSRAELVTHRNLALLAAGAAAGVVILFAAEGRNA